MPRGGGGRSRPRLSLPFQHGGAAGILQSSERYTTEGDPSLPALYHPGVVTFAPHYDIGSGRDAVNVLEFQTPASGLTFAQLDSARLAFDVAWSTFWKPYGAPSVFYKGAIVTDMSSNTGGQALNTGVTPAPGTGGGNEVIDNTAVLISLKTSTRYRGGHGRIYLPGCNVGMLNNDGRSVLSSQITAGQSRWTTFITAMSAITTTGGGPYSLIVWHKKLSSNPNSIENVNAAVIQPVLASQRRRLRKVSRHHRR